jgi:hypothetical protein
MLPSVTSWDPSANALALFADPRGICHLLGLGGEPFNALDICYNRAVV